MAMKGTKREVLSTAIQANFPEALGVHRFVRVPGAREHPWVRGLNLSFADLCRDLWYAHCA